jgi:Uma2 family endonuclease
MIIEQQRYTVEEFWQIAQLPENEARRLELEDGVIVEMASSSPVNTIIAGRIIYHLNAFVIPHDLGYVTVLDGGFRLAPRVTRQPDVAFIRKSRLPVIPRHFEMAPDIAVEVVSDSEDVLKKVLEYLHAGSSFVWTVYHDVKTVYVFTLDNDKSLRGVPYGVDDMLDGGDVLAGFTLPVRAIFP